MPNTKRIKKKQNETFLVKKRRRKIEKKEKHQEIKRREHGENKKKAKPRASGKKSKYRHMPTKYWPTEKAPAHFSLTKSPDGTLAFFGRLSEKINKEKAIRVDLSDVKKITIDSLLYLIVVLKESARQGLLHDVCGRYPFDNNIKEMVHDSGFDKYVKGGQSFPGSVERCVPICHGSGEYPEISKKMCAFTREKLGVRKNQTSKLYDMISEILENSTLHAHKRRRGKHVPRWYAFARYDKEDECIHLSLLDTGDGIPHTVKKKASEKALILAEKITLGMIRGMDASALIQSALEGEIRSSTGKEHRGNGLPQIYEYSQIGFIKSLVILSDRGYINPLNGNKNLQCGFKGTLYSWKVDKDSLGNWNE
jgi:hypothetical protein